MKVNEYITSEWECNACKRIEECIGDLPKEWNIYETPQGKFSICPKCNSDRELVAKIIL